MKIKNKVQYKDKRRSLNNHLLKSLIIEYIKDQQGPLTKSKQIWDDINIEIKKMGMIEYKELNLENLLRINHFLTNLPNEWHNRRSFNAEDFCIQTNDILKK